MSSRRVGPGSLVQIEAGDVDALTARANICARGAGSTRSDSGLMEVESANGREAPFGSASHGFEGTPPRTARADRHGKREARSLRGVGEVQALRHSEPGRAAVLREVERRGAERVAPQQLRPHRRWRQHRRWRWCSGWRGRGAGVRRRRAVSSGGEPTEAEHESEHRSTRLGRGAVAAAEVAAAEVARTRRSRFSYLFSCACRHGHVTLHAGFRRARCAQASDGQPRPRGGR